MPFLLRAVAVAPIVALAACAGSPAGPAPTPTPTPGATVVAVVFYDENGDGRAGADETMRVPDVQVTIGGQSARTEKGTGRAVVTGVPNGAQTLSISRDSLPPFFAPEGAMPVQVPPPAGGPIMLGLTLPIAGNEANVYMAFGDSITRGDGATGGGYPPDLQNRLAAHFSRALVQNRGADSTNSFEGVERIRRNLNIFHPAYTLILYGTNDWNAPECQDNPQCATVDNLRTIVRAVKDYRSLPFLGTIIPANPVLSPAGRNKWVADVNDLVRPMAREEGAFLVDLHRAFLAQPTLAALFTDHVHPNDAGYRVMAETFFEAIAHGRATPTAAGSSGTSAAFATRFSILTPGPTR